MLACSKAIHCVIFTQKVKDCQHAALVKSGTFLLCVDELNNWVKIWLGLFFSSVMTLSGICLYSSNGGTAGIQIVPWGQQRGAREW